MYRVFTEVDNAWQLDQELDKLPKDFQFVDGQMVEHDNDDGTTTIMHAVGEDGISDIPLTQ